MKKINVVLPVYNEEDVIQDFHDALTAVTLSLEEYLFEIIYVVDKSSDNTLSILKKIAETDLNVCVISLSKRFGHQMSLVAGIDQCDGDAVIMMDCDLEHPPRVIRELLCEYEKGYDIVNTQREYNKKISFLKVFTSNLYYKIINLLSDTNLTEGSADFRLISKKVCKVFQKQIREHNQFLRGLVQWVGFKQTSVKFISEPRRSGISKYTIKRLINFAIAGVLSFSKIPLKISIFMGLILSLFSFVYGLYAIFTHFFTGTVYQGWTSIIALTSFIGGIVLIVLGIIGEYVGAIFDEVKNKPLYIIDEIIGRGMAAEKMRC